MSVYQRGDVWHYDFWHRKVRHTSPKGFETRDEAAEAEVLLKRTLTRRAAGLEALDARDTPTFTSWAGVTLKWQRDRKKIKRPDEAKNTQRMILAFWGHAPAKDPVEGGLYKGLRLGDPIQQPELIEEFEQWMDARKLSNARKNHYRSACSMLYRVALLAPNRRKSGVRENPFLGLARDRVQKRTTTFSVEQMQTWLASAPVTVSVAVTIGALAPALRFGNIAELERAVHLSPARDYLTVPHKTDRETGQPLTLSISPPLQRVIAAVEAQWPDDPYVVPMFGTRNRYWHLHKLVRQSIRDAGLPYGRTVRDGITFHTLRHALSTWLARWGVSVAERQRALAHATPQMAAWYTHLSGADTVGPMALIGERVPIADAVVTQIGRVVPQKSRTRGQKPVPQAGLVSVGESGA